MANRKISDLTSLTAPATGDLLPIVDISEAAAVNKNKKITYGELLASAPAGTAAAPSFSFDADPNTGLYSAGADQVAITTGGSERLRIDSSGKLLIGTSSAAAQALCVIQGFAGTTAGQGILSLQRGEDVPANGAVLGVINFTNSNSNAGAQINAARDGGTWTSGASHPSRITFNIAANGSTALTERMRIDSSGRVGIGTSAPTSTLTVSGTARVQQASSFAGINVRNDNDSSVSTTTSFLDASNNLNTIDGHIFFEHLITGGSVASIATTPAGDRAVDRRVTRLFINSAGTTTLNSAASTAPFIALIASAEVARIDSSGRLLVGTSSIILGSPQTLIEKSTSDLDILRVQCGALEVSNNLAGIAFGQGPGGARPKVAIASIASGGFGRGSLAFFIDQAADNNSVSSSDEVARIDSSGRLLVGTSSATGNFLLQTQGQAGDITAEGGLVLRRGLADASISTGNGIGTLNFAGLSGGIGAQIRGVSEAQWGSGDYPTRLVFSTTADGAASPTERLRITNDGVIAYDQPAPAAVNATATLTVTNLKAGIITSTSAAATDMTLPTGTDTQAGFSGTYDNFTFEWSVINTGVSLVRVLAGTAHTVVGSGSVATGTSGRFASRRTAANTFVTYRLA